MLKSTMNWRRLSAAFGILVTILILPANGLNSQTSEAPPRAGSPQADPVQAPAPQTGIDWSKALVESEMKRHPNPGFSSWGYARALYLFGEYLVWKRTGDDRYFAYVKGWIDAHVDEQGNIDRNLESLDYMLPGNLLLVLYQETKLEKYKLAADKIRKRLDTYPRTSDGGFWHANTKSRQSQLWLDGMFMSMPFLVRYGQMFGQSAYANDEAAGQLLTYASHLSDPSKGLLYHAYDESGVSKWADPTTHHSAEFWCRAIGWYGITLIDILEVLPANHPKRPQLIAILQKLIRDLAKYQDSNTGLWYQVVDKGSVADNWLETSSSSMYTYVISMAIKRGYVGAEYNQTARKGYRGVLSKLSIGPDGLADIHDICEGTNVGDLAYYLARKRNTNDFHGLGAFLLMNEHLLTSASSMELTVPRRKVIRMAIVNPSDESRLAEDIVVDTGALKRADPTFIPEAALVTTSGESTLEQDASSWKRSELPSQVDDLNGDGRPDELAFQIDLPPKQTRIVTISYGDPGVMDRLRGDYPRRTYAKFNKHYDGMGWESEQTAWRLYFDKRNALGLWGKRKPGLYLEMFGAPGYKYQEESPLGRDIYNVGKSLGAGAVGALMDGRATAVSEVGKRDWRVVNTGPVRAIVEFSYRGWKAGGSTVNLTSRITQWAGERGYVHRATLRDAPGFPLVAGFSRKPDLKEISGGPFCSLGIWGPQVVKPGTGATESLANENLGLAILVPHGSKDCHIEGDPNNYLVKTPLQNGTAEWYVLAAWDQEEVQPIKSLDEFAALIASQRSRFSEPASVTILPKGQ